jgi:hypothetical protein
MAPRYVARQGGVTAAEHSPAQRTPIPTVPDDVSGGLDTLPPATPAETSCDPEGEWREIAAQVISLLMQVRKPAQ